MTPRSASALSATSRRGLAARAALAACSALAALTACAAGDATANRLGVGAAEVAAVLAFLNDCDTTLEVLDEDVPLDADAAAALVRHRDGPDQACGGADDDLFDDLDEVEAVPQVGDASVLALVDFVALGGGDGGGTWDGVSFTAEQAEAALTLANEASEQVLDEEVGLDADAARSLVNNRPFDDMGAVADAPQVGEAALLALRDFAG